MKDLKPTDKLLVHDLLSEAGFDVSDWKNYRRPQSPASNPKYCYKWAFEGEICVALCLWHEHMQQDSHGVFQQVNYREEGRGTAQWTSVKRSRAKEMDRIILRAWDERLPVRVIVVDGKVSDSETSHVTRRLLDPIPWFVAQYDDQGNCRLQRSSPDGKAQAGERRLTRIAYNSSDWQRPTGDAQEQESSGTYNAKNGFGHEDWLFRSEWVVDGWRYAFIQGLNRNRAAYQGRPLDLTLFTIQPDTRRRLIATIYGLEVLADQQAKDAVAMFRSKGWLDTMRAEVQAARGEIDALDDSRLAQHILNVRYRVESVDRYPPDRLLPDDDWIRDRHRYQLYKFTAAEQGRLEFSSSTRRGRQDAPETRRLFRKGTKPVAYTPEHDEMQRKLMAELKAEYGAKRVWREQDFVDVRVETDQELIYFEIKTDLDPRAVIRQALGQILEYAYHPARAGRRADRLVIVGRAALGKEDRGYLSHLCEVFRIPVSYRVVAI